MSNPDRSPVLTGFLQKQSGNMFKSWQTRYFELFSPAQTNESNSSFSAQKSTHFPTLTYYETNKKLKLLGSLQLSMCEFHSSPKQIAIWNAEKTKMGSNLCKTRN